MPSPYHRSFPAVKNFFIISLLTKRHKNSIDTIRDHNFSLPSWIFISAEVDTVNGEVLE